MKKNFLTIVIITTLLSCKSKSSLPDLSGDYENTEDDSVTKIEKLNDSQYLIYAPDGKDKITATRNGNTLNGTFDGMQISEEFNAACDTMTYKENGKITFQSAKMAE